MPIPIAPADRSTTDPDPPRPEPGGSTAERDELATARREIGEVRAALAAAEARERALAYELQHRVRNMLAVIRSIYRRSRESGASQDEFAEHFEGRLDAIGRYQSYIDDAYGPGIEVEDILRNELLETQRLDGPGCTIDGPPVRLSRKHAELMGLAIHELTTNSIKFGALAQDGDLAVTWLLDEADDGSRLRFHWRESGVAVAGAAPRPRGFGRQLIEEALPYQLGATTSFALKPGGAECHILLPLAGADQRPTDRREPDAPTPDADETEAAS